MRRSSGSNQARLGDDVMDVQPQPRGFSGTPVECMEITFENDEARRAYFIEKLREKLADPEFRKIGGFPIGKDEDILALSDPPYYTACPNPFIGDFIKLYGKSYDPNVPYSKKPFAVDVSEGKNDPIYNAHPYHTKVPPRAIARYILHYTKPGDIVLDFFCGTGMTGVGARISKDKAIDIKGNDKSNNCTSRSEEERSTECEQNRQFSTRFTILCDLSPLATWISYGLNRLLNPKFISENRWLLEKACTEIDLLYNIPFEGQNRNLLYLVWSDVLICPNCSRYFSYWDAAIDVSSGTISEDFLCPGCNASISKRDCAIAATAEFDHALQSIIPHSVRSPTIAVFQNGSRNERHIIIPEQRLYFKDLEDIEGIDVPRDRIDKDLDIWWDRDYRQYGIYSIDRFFTNRALKSLSSLKIYFSYQGSHVIRHLGLWILTAILRDCSLMTGLDIRKFFHGGGGPFAGGVKGTFFVPSLAVEKNVTFSFRNRLNSIERIANSLEAADTTKSLITTQSATDLHMIPDNTIDYIFVDPPFGSNFIYSELNMIHEAWLGVKTADSMEAVMHRRRKNQATTIKQYQDLMRRCFSEGYRVLKPGRWITVEFSNTHASVWNALQTALLESGFVIANISALDKQQGSFKAVTTPTAAKQDLVISAYKPNSGLEDRFKLEAGTEEGGWDFIRTHLKQLPLFIDKSDKLELISERQNFLLYDRLVAFHLRRGVTVPLSASEFYAGLAQRFPERDGMYFLPEQAAEYDKKRMNVKEIIQLQLSITDESSAIQWIKQQLAKKPQTLQDLTPTFMKELAGWSKHEKLLELRELMEQNFIMYESDGEVPGPIHSYLSTTFKELRNLSKTDPALVAKAKNRWYIPDPRRASDLEKLREKALLNEFHLIAESKKRIKEFRIEAVRAGFKKCWDEGDHKTILEVAKKLPTSVVEEDSHLLMYTDLARMRQG